MKKEDPTKSTSESTQDPTTKDTSKLPTGTSPYGEAIASGTVASETSGGNVTVDARLQWDDGALNPDGSNGKLTAIIDLRPEAAPDVRAPLINSVLTHVSRISSIRDLATNVMYNVAVAQTTPPSQGDDPDEIGISDGERRLRLIARHGVPVKYMGVKCAMQFEWWQSTVNEHDKSITWNIYVAEAQTVHGVLYQPGQVLWSSGPSRLRLTGQLMVRLAMTEAPPTRQ